MKPIYIRRLKKLEVHLRRGKLAHKKFYFGAWNADKYLRAFTTNGCEFAGCAIGECPKVFRRHWRWCKGAPRLRLSSVCDPAVSAQKFFGLSERKADGLFLPRSLH